jgi:hypothetical protein
MRIIGATREQQSGQTKSQEEIFHKIGLRG